MFLLLVENHLCKPKRHIIPHFCIVQQIVSVWASKIYLNQWNTISITLQKWSLKRDKISFVFTKLPWEPILDQYCSIEIPILPFVVLILSKQQTLSNMLRWILNSSRRMQVQYSLFHFMTLSGAFRCLQAPSNTFKLSVVQPASIDQADSC